MVFSPWKDSLSTFMPFPIDAMHFIVLDGYIKSAPRHIQVREEDSCYRFYRIYCIDNLWWLIIVIWYQYHTGQVLKYRISGKKGMGKVRQRERVNQRDHARLMASSHRSKHYSTYSTVSHYSMIHHSCRCSTQWSTVVHVVLNDPPQQ